MPNTHRRRRRDETVLSHRVGVGGVYMNSRRLPTDSAMRTHNAAVGRDPVHDCRRVCSHQWPATYLLTFRVANHWFTPTTRRNCRQLVANSCTHSRRDETRQFRLVGVGGVYWALPSCAYMHSVRSLQRHSDAWLCDVSGRLLQCRLRRGSEDDHKTDSLWGQKSPSPPPGPRGRARGVYSRTPECYTACKQPVCEMPWFPNSGI